MLGLKISSKSKLFAECPLRSRATSATLRVFISDMTTLQHCTDKEALHKENVSRGGI